MLVFLETGDPQKWWTRPCVEDPPAYAAKSKIAGSLKQAALIEIVVRNSPRRSPRSRCVVSSCGFLPQSWEFDSVRTPHEPLQVLPN